MSHWASKVAGSSSLKGIVKQSKGFFLVHSLKKNSKTDLKYNKHPTNLKIYVTLIHFYVVFFLLCDIGSRLFLNGSVASCKDPFVLCSFSPRCCN